MKHPEYNFEENVDFTPKEKKLYKAFGGVIVVSIVLVVIFTVIYIVQNRLW